MFVPPSADETVLGLLAALRAQIVTCPRRAADPPGDPCVHRFREAVARLFLGTRLTWPGARHALVTALDLHPPLPLIPARS